MTEEEREAIYDREIAPALLTLAKKCEGLDFSIVAAVEWFPGDVGKTMSVRAGSGIDMRMILMTAQAKGNADALISSLLRHGKEHGHNSAYLRILEMARDAAA